MQFPNMSPMNFLNGIMQQNPSMQGQPQVQELIRIVQSNDYNALQQMGQNLCNSYGVNPQDVLNQNAQNFGFRF